MNGYKGPLSSSGCLVKFAVAAILTYIAAMLLILIISFFFPIF